MHWQYHIPHYQYWLYGIGTGYMSENFAKLCVTCFTNIYLVIYLPIYVPVPSGTMFTSTNSYIGHVSVKISLTISDASRDSQILIYCWLTSLCIRLVVGQTNGDQVSIRWRNYYITRSDRGSWDQIVLLRVTWIEISPGLLTARSRTGYWVVIWILSWGLSV